MVHHIWYSHTAVAPIYGVPTSGERLFARSSRFKVSWIGFSFNIPGVTADPTLVAQNFYNTGYDVVTSGIDTTEVLVVAKQKRQQGMAVWALPYDFSEACEGAADVCIGVPISTGVRVLCG